MSSSRNLRSASALGTESSPAKRTCVETPSVPVPSPEEAVPQVVVSHTVAPEVTGTARPLVNASEALPKMRPSYAQAAQARKRPLGTTPAFPRPGLGPWGADVQASGLRVHGVAVSAHSQPTSPVY